MNSVFPAEGSGYFISGVDLTQWRVPVYAEPISHENFLFHRVKDPWQEENLWEFEQQRRERMLGVMGNLLMQEGTPKEQYERLGIDEEGNTSSQ